MSETSEQEDAEAATNAEAAAAPPRMRPSARRSTAFGGGDGRVKNNESGAHRDDDAERRDGTHQDSQLHDEARDEIRSGAGPTASPVGDYAAAASSRFQMRNIYGPEQEYEPHNPQLSYNARQATPSRQPSNVSRGSNASMPHENPWINRNRGGTTRMSYETPGTGDSGLAELANSATSTLAGQYARSFAVMARRLLQVRDRRSAMLMWRDESMPRARGQQRDHHVRFLPSNEMRQYHDDERARARRHMVRNVFATLARHYLSRFNYEVARRQHQLRNEIHRVERGRNTRRGRSETSSNTSGSTSPMTPTLYSAVRSGSSSQSSSPSSRAESPTFGHRDSHSNRGTRNRFGTPPPPPFRGGSHESPHVTTSAAAAGMRSAAPGYPPAG